MFCSSDLLVENLVQNLCPTFHGRSHPSQRSSERLHLLSNLWDCEISTLHHTSILNQESTFHKLMCNLMCWHQCLLHAFLQAPVFHTTCICPLQVLPRDLPLLRLVPAEREPVTIHPQLHRVRTRYNSNFHHPKNQKKTMMT